MMNGFDKMELLNFLGRINQLVNLTANGIKPFSTAQVGDQDKFVLYDDEHPREDVDDSPTTKKYPIVSFCLIVPEHEHDIIGTLDDDDDFSGLTASVVVDDDGECHVLIHADCANPDDEIQIVIEHGRYYTA